MLCLALPVTQPDRPLPELLEQLEHTRPERRRTAVRALAELGGRRAWEAVVQSLEDPEGMVADAAQVELAELDDSAVISALLGRGGLGHKEPWVRLRVAEAVGRMGLSLPGKRLAARLSPRDPAASEALLWSLERLHGRGLLEGDVRSLARRAEGCMGRNAPGFLRAQALWTAQALDPDDRRLARARKDRDPEVRLAGLLWMEQRAEDSHGASDLLRVASEAAQDERSAVRLAAASVLGRIGTPGALGVLVERLPVEERLVVQARLVSVLRQATGLRHRSDPRPWRRFLEAQPKGARVTPVQGRRAAGEARSAGSAERFPVNSDRAAYLVDLSGSTWNRRQDGRTRKELVDGMLVATLDALPDGSRFNVIPYTGRPHPWREELVEATRRNVRSAQESFSELDVTGPGDVWSAIELALEDGAVDTIVLVTDGAPTGGQRHDLGLMMELLRQRLRWRPVRFDLVLVDSPARLVRVWRALAESTGGTCLELAFAPRKSGE